MLIVFFYIRGIVHHKFVPQGQTVNAAFYVEVLKCPRERVRRVRPELWAEKNWKLHHDNASSHSVLTARKFFAKNYMITMDHPSYSPDLAPWNFILFPKVKTIAWWTFWWCREHQTWNNEVSEEPNFTGHATLFFYNGKSVGPSAFTREDSTLRVTMCPFQNNGN
jgi:hypothetical protein